MDLLIDFKGNAILRIFIGYMQIQLIDFIGQGTAVWYINEGVFILCKSLDLKMIIWAWKRHYDDLSSMS